MLSALKWAGKFVTVTSSEINAIFQARKSLLYHNNTPWTKNSGQFDVTMGSYDGAEVCELVGLYILSQMQHLNLDKGLYRDDGLSACDRPARM